MDTNLKLSQAQHDLVWERREAIEKRFRVWIESPFLQSDNPYKMLSNYAKRNDIVIIRAKGKIDGVEAFEKYIKEAFVNPEIIEIFSYCEDLKPVFGNNMFIEIFEEIYNVCISIKPDCELNISGTECSVSSVVSTMEMIITQYNASKHLPLVRREESLSQELVLALKSCKNVDIPVDSFLQIPNSVINFLLSLLRKTYNWNLLLSTKTSSLDDSVIVLDAPVEKADITVVVLDSDSDNADGENNPKCFKKCPSKNMEAENEKKKRKCKTPLRSKKRRVLDQNPNFLFNLQGQNGLENFTAHKDRLLNSEVESSANRCKQPVVDNANFIPLSLERRKKNSVQLNLKNKVSEAPAEGQIKLTGAATSEDTVPESIPKAPKRLRPVVIDGCNVAFYSTPGRREDFSWKRIEISMKHFMNRGHRDVKIFVPQYRRGLCYEKAGSQKAVDQLENEQVLIFTPSRKIDGRIVSCYDDRFIVDLAHRKEGIILSNDNYRDLMSENLEWSKTIKERLLMYVFVGEELMLPADPLGPKGPHLNDFLAFPDQTE